MLTTYQASQMAQSVGSILGTVITGFALSLQRQNSTSTRVFQFEMWFYLRSQCNFFKNDWIVAFFNFPLLVRKMTRGNDKNNHLKGIPLQKFFCKGLSSAFPAFSVLLRFKKKGVWNMSTFTQPAHKASVFSSCRHIAGTHLPNLWF